MDSDTTCYACGEDDDQCTEECICVNCEIDSQRRQEETTR